MSARFPFLPSRPWRFAAVAGAGIVTFALVAGAVLTQTQGGRDWLAASLSALASSADETITIDGIDGLLLGPLTVRRLTIADAEGEWLRVEEARAALSLLPLLSGTITASLVRAERVRLSRFPVAEEGEARDSGSGFLTRVALAQIALPEVIFPTGERRSGAVAVAGAVTLDLRTDAADIDLELTGSGDRGDRARVRVLHAPDARTLTADIHFQEDAGGLVSGLLGLAERPAIVLDAAVAGPYARLNGTLSAALGGKAVASASLESRDVAGGARIVLDAAVHAARLAPAEAGALAPGRSDIHFTGVQAGDGGLTIETLSLTNAATQITARGIVSAARALDLVFEARHAPLGAASDLDGLGVPLAIGAARGDLALRGPIGKAALTGTVTVARLTADALSLRDLTLVPDGSVLALDTGAAALSLTGEGGALTLRDREAGAFSLIFEGSLGSTAMRADRVTLTAEALQLTASGAIEGPRLDGRVEGEIHDARFLREDLSGTVSLSGQIEGLHGSMLLKGQVLAPALAADGRALTDLVLAVEGRSRRDAPLTMTATLSGAIDGEALNARGALTPGEDGYDATLTASLPGSTAEAAARLVEGDVQGGTLGLQASDLSALGTLAGAPLAGALQAAASFSRGAGAPQLTISATGAPMIGGTRINGFALALAPSADGHDLDLTGVVDGRPIALDASLVGDGRQRLTLARLAAQIASERLRLAEPVAVITDGALAEALSARLSLARGGGIDVAATTAPAFALQARLQRLPASLLDLAVPDLDAGGAISGTLALARDDSVAFDLSWDAASLAETRAQRLPALRLTAAGRLAADRLSLTANAAGEGTDLAVTGGIALGDPAALDLKASGTVALALLQGAVAREGLTLGGAALIDAAITGAARAPAIQGSITLRDAAVREASSGISLVGGTGVIRFDASRAVLDGVQAFFQRGGRVLASGAIDYGGNGISPDLTIQLQKAKHTDGELVTAEADGTVTLKPGPEGRLVLGGTVTLNETTILVPERVPPTLEAIPVTHRNAPADVAAQDALIHPSADNAASDNQSPLLDLTLHAPRRLFVRGRGIDAEFGGSLALTGAASAPQARGAFTLRRGRYDIAGKRLTLTRGEVSFRGSLTPVLDFAADTVSSGTTATIAIAGSASAPAVSLSSQPTLPSDEILSRVLFDRSLDKLSPFQLAQLASAAAEIAGVGAGPSPLERIRARLGLADLDVTSDESGGTALSTGQYLSDKVYLGASEGTTPGSRRVTIDLDLTDDLKLRGEAAADGSTGAGIAYEYDY